MISAKKKKNRVGQEAKIASYHRRRKVLLKALGGCCEKCGSTNLLTLDHKTEEGRTWGGKGENGKGSIKIGRMQRIKLYEEDYLDDKLRVLCNSCNCEDGIYRRYHGKPKPPPNVRPKDIPF